MSAAWIIAAVVGAIAFKATRKKRKRSSAPPPPQEPISAQHVFTRPPPPAEPRIPFEGGEPPRGAAPSDQIGPELPPLPPPLFHPEIYPKGAGLATLPPVHTADGIVFSEDCNVVGIGPLWWRHVGEDAEGLIGDGITNPDELTEALWNIWVPEHIDFLECVGPHALHSELVVKVREFIKATQE